MHSQWEDPMMRPPFLLLSRNLQTRKKKASILYIYLCVCVCIYICAVLSCFICVQLCWDPKDCSLPGSSVHGILQAWIPEWMDGHSLLQGIFPTQVSNRHLLCLTRIGRRVLFHYKRKTVIEGTEWNPRDWSSEEHWNIYTWEVNTSGRTEPKTWIGF